MGVKNFHLGNALGQELKRGCMVDIAKSDLLLKTSTTATD